MGDSATLTRILSTPLKALNDSDWEALCDQCGRCCLIKLEDEQTNEVFYTNVVCRLYDIEKGCCSDYANRKQFVPDCVVIKSFSDEIYSQLPKTCAYRLRYNNEALPQWHPLVGGGKQRMQQDDISIKNRAVSEEFIHQEQLEDHIIDDIQ